MAYEKKDGDIAVFKNDKREKDTHPHWKGEALIDGRKYEVAFWEKGGKGTMLAGGIKLARQQAAQPAPAGEMDSPF